MTALQIFLLLVPALAIGALRTNRQLLLLAVSSLVVFWLQPAEPFASLAFWLPVGSLTLAVLTWALTCAPESRGWKQNAPALAVLFGVILLADLNRYLQFTQVFTAGTPVLPLTLLALVLIGAAAFGLTRWHKAQGFWQWSALLGLLAIFIFLKSPALLARLLGLLSSLRPQNSGAGTIALSWLGYSYLAFRLMHTIRDRQAGRLPAVTLAEYVNYVIFFPAFTAGPIDRLERFVGELRAPLPLEDPDWIEAGSRLFMGLFKKFVLADLLATISISDVLVAQTKGAGWLWLFLYAYSFRIFLDFSGYTDIAIGLGRLLGIRLPENFAAPYLKPNLTQFWNSWHMTLTQWFRAYFFNPVTRALRGGGRALPVWIIVFITQVSTMLLIGLWHGITAGFAVWGLWHGLGLFVQNRWSAWARPRLPGWMQTGRGQAVMNALGILVTFHFVSLGWLFFTLSTPGIAWQALLKLFALSPLTGNVGMSNHSWKVRVLRRLPTAGQLIPVFGVITLLDYGWTAWSFFWHLPSWLHFLRTDEILVLLAYGLTTDLFDSLLVLLLLALPCLFLPAGWWQQRFVARGAALTLAGLWYFMYLASLLNNQGALPLFAVRIGPLPVLAAALGIAYIVGAQDRLRRLTENLADRAIIFLYIFIPASLASLLTVAVRNLFFRSY